MPYHGDLKKIALSTHLNRARALNNHSRFLQHLIRHLLESFRLQGNQAISRAYRHQGLLSHFWINIRSRQNHHDPAFWILVLKLLNHTGDESRVQGNQNIRSLSHPIANPLHLYFVSQIAKHLHPLFRRATIAGGYLTYFRGNDKNPHFLIYSRDHLSGDCKAIRSPSIIPLSLQKKKSLGSPHEQRQKLWCDRRWKN